MNVLVCVVRALFSDVKKLIHNNEPDYPNTVIEDQEIHQGVHKAKMKQVFE